ncbi:hypothetical protein E2C01_054184 [Portunus trituberculatus]|uniref:Uncharacterized protein n=1 Tax=Portunus trituberculatus TaxID=210409 RepID=A0A5B7GR96_PORTR|nr:hypothetical protein [Portunus trituberculatus]
MPRLTRLTMSNDPPHTTPSYCHEVSPLTPKGPLRPASVWCMAHSVASFIASCSARCHHKPGTRAHSPPDCLEGTLITPLGLPPI